MFTGRSVGSYEKRFLNFFIRATFHDSLAVDPTICDNYPNSNNCGGADSSVLLSVSEMTRSENNYDDFAFIASRAVIKIASFYDVSASDVIAVSFAGTRSTLILGTPLRIFCKHLYSTTCLHASM